MSQKFKDFSISFAGMPACYRCQHQYKKSRKTWNNPQWLCQMVKLPCSALKPCSGTRELPVTNCSSRARRSSSYSSTARQNQRTMFVSSEQCFNRLCRFQSSMSILPRPPIISCTTNNNHTHLWNWGSYICTQLLWCSFKWLVKQRNICLHVALPLTVHMLISTENDMYCTIFKYNGVSLEKVDKFC